MWLNTPVSTLTETSILYTDDTQTDTQIHRHKDGQADSIIPPPQKKIVLWGYKKFFIISNLKNLDVMTFDSIHVSK